MLYPEYKHVPPTDLHLHDPKSLTMVPEQGLLECRSVLG
jgi:hypothetical protein